MEHKNYGYVGDVSVTQHKSKKERPFAEGSSDYKFYRPSKIMVLTGFELSLPPL
jgi:hypothetical protein